MSFLRARDGGIPWSIERCAINVDPVQNGAMFFPLRRKVMGSSRVVLTGSRSPCDFFALVNLAKSIYI